MKPSITYFLILLTLLIGCNEDVVLIKEVPEKIVTTTPCPELHSNFNELFPEYFNNFLRQPALFSDSTQKDILLTHDSEVYVTFIAEGATLQNTLGWYEFNSLEVPQNPNDIELHILFPHISSEVIATGDRLQLGNEKFKKGTVIGFFFITNGWQNGVINYSNITLFSTLSLNIDQRQQHVLFVDKLCGNLVLAFEDIPVSFPSCDFDFNDIMLTVSDNSTNSENNSFEQNHLAKL